MFNASFENSLNVLIVSISSNDYVFRKNTVSYFSLLRNVYRNVCKLGHWFSEMERVSVFLRSVNICLLYTSPSPRDGLLSRMPSSA